MFRIVFSRTETVLRSHLQRRAPRRKRCIPVVALVACLAALPAAAQTAISADGEVESKSGGFKFPDGTVQTTTAADTDPLHVVGEPGEPPFGNGGSGDCLWGNPPPEFGLLAAANPVSFSKDSDGIVRLAGVPAAFDGPGGDGICDITDNVSDTLIFQLPAGYQPEHVEIFPSGNATIVLNLIIPQGGLIIDEEFLPGGAVLAGFIEDGNATTLDGFTFRAAPPTASPSPAPATFSLQGLRELLGRR